MLPLAAQLLCLPLSPALPLEQRGGMKGCVLGLVVGYTPGPGRYCRVALLAAADPHRLTAVVITLRPSVSCSCSCGELNSLCGRREPVAALANPF